MTDNDRSNTMSDRDSPIIENDDAWFRSDQARALGVHIDQLNVLPRSDYLDSEDEQISMDMDSVPDRTDPLVDADEIGDVQRNLADDQRSRIGSQNPSQNSKSMQTTSQGSSSVRNTSSIETQNINRSDVDYYLDYTGDPSIVQMQTTSDGRSSERITSRATYRLGNRSTIGRNRIISDSVQRSPEVINYEIPERNQTVPYDSPSRSQKATSIVNQNVDTREEIGNLPGRVNLADQINLGSTFQARTNASSAQTQATGVFIRNPSPPDPWAFPLERGFQEIMDGAEGWYMSLDDETQTRVRKSGRLSLSVSLWQRFQTMRTWSPALAECVQILQTAQRLVSILSMMYHREGVDNAPGQLTDRYEYLKAFMFELTLLMQQMLECKEMLSLPPSMLSQTDRTATLYTFARMQGELLGYGGQWSRPKTVSRPTHTQLTDPVEPGEIDEGRRPPPELERLPLVRVNTPRQQRGENVRDMFDETQTGHRCSAIV